MAFAANTMSSFAGSSSDLAAAETALKNRDIPYAYLRLRKAWLSSKSNNLNDDEHKRIKDCLISVYQADGRELDALNLREGRTNVTELDSLFKLREQQDNVEQYSVELGSDGKLVFQLNNLDWVGEPTCGNIKMTANEALVHNAQADAIRQTWKKKLPLVFEPKSIHYSELLKLSQPLKNGQKRPSTGFDLSPFVPKDLPRTNDL
jgi:hypothetical protein